MLYLKQNESFKQYMIHFQNKKAHSLTNKSFMMPNMN